jgi:hypothetical protein
MNNWEILAGFAPLRGVQRDQSPHGDARGDSDSVKARLRVC